MKVPTLWCFFLVITLEIHAKNLDSGEKAVNKSNSTSASMEVSSKSEESSETSQKNKKRYATQQVILYLTPSQIRELEAGKEVISSQPLPESVEQEQQNSHDLKLKERTEFVKQEFENLKSASIPQVEQPNAENIELVSQEPLHQKRPSSDNQEFEYLWIQQQADREEQLKLLRYYYELNKAQQQRSQLDNNYNSDRNAWFAFSPSTHVNEGYSVHEPQQENQIIDQNPFQLRFLPSLSLYDQNSELILPQNQKPLLQLQYFPKYNDQEKAIAIEKILRTHHRHQLEKQSALSQIEKISNSPPVVHEHVKVLKPHPFPIVKKVKVPVPAPVLVSVPQPSSGNVFHPYTTLQEIIKHIPLPIMQKERVEIERSLPYKTESQIPVPVTQIVLLYVDRPYFDKKFVPGEIKQWS